MKYFNLARTTFKPLMLSSLIGMGLFQFNKYEVKKKTFALAKADLPKGKLPDYFEEIDVEATLKRFPNLTIIRTKAIENLMGKIRDVNTTREQFRFLSRRIIRIIVEEALGNECTEEVVKQSPLGYYKTKVNPREISQYVAVSIMRSGNGMAEEIMTICPEINIGKILLQRDETTHDKKPIFFFEKLPKKMENKRIFLLDPMLATGGSVMTCISVLKEKGVKEENIIFLNIISCEDGLKTMFDKFPNVKVVTAKVDPKLLPNKYIAPGIGDFGDRFYGTDDE